MTHLADQRIGDVWVLCLLEPNADKAKQVWLCRCLRCQKECRLTGWVLIYSTAIQCCKPCRKLEKGKGRDVSKEYMPTPEQIKATCIEIRKSWDGNTKAERRNRSATDWSVPVVRVVLE